MIRGETRENPARLRNMIDRFEGTRQNGNHQRTLVLAVSAPGMVHCGGGAAAVDSFDLLSAVVDWVEKGAAPNSVTGTSRAQPGRSRPLCSFRSTRATKDQAIPKLRRASSAASRTVGTIVALNMNLFYGIGIGRGWSIPRLLLGIDLSVLLSVANFVALAWQGRIVASASNETVVRSAFRSRRLDHAPNSVACAGDSEWNAVYVARRFGVPLHSHNLTGHKPGAHPLAGVGVAQHRRPIAITKDTVIEVSPGQVDLQRIARELGNLLRPALDATLAVRDLSAAATPNTIRLEVAPSGKLDDAEAYELTTAAGGVRIVASAPAGIFYECRR